MKALSFLISSSKDIKNSELFCVCVLNACLVEKLFCYSHMLLSFPGLLSPIRQKRSPSSLSTPLQVLVSCLHTAGVGVRSCLYTEESQGLSACYISVNF